METPSDSGYQEGMSSSAPSAPSVDALLPTSVSSGSSGALPSGSDSQGPTDRVKDVYCYDCGQQAIAAECIDLEYRCMQCGSSSVEWLERKAPHALDSDDPWPPAPIWTPPMDAQGANTSNHSYRNGRLPELTRRTARRHSTHLTHSHQNRRTAVSAERFLERYGENSRERPREAISRAPRIHHHRPSSRHIGVICDGCNIRDFTGIRYRCQVCRDYDLCAACYSQRGQLHETHPFEAIRTPRSQVRRLISDLMSRAANQTVISIIEIGIEEGFSEQPTGLDDDAVAWWLANERRLVDVDSLIEQDPAWTCSICAEGLEVEGENGWVVGICGTSTCEEDPTAVADPPLPSASSHRPSAPDAAEPTGSQHVVTHEMVPSDSPCTSYHLVPIAAPDVPNAIDDGLVDGPEALDDALMVASADAPPALPEAVAGDASSDGQAKECKDEKGKASSAEGHIFHEGCLRRWLIKKNSCPVCRSSPVIPA